MDNGFIMLSRKLFSHRIWKASRTFSECEAWIDLIQSARFEATVTIERIGGRDITYGRGQYPASISFLSKRWGWKSEKKVRNFLDILKKEGMITTDAKQGMNVITLCKYDDYNAPYDSQGKPKGKGDGIDIAKKINDLECALGKLKASVGATVGQGEGNNNKKDKKENKDIIPPTPLKGNLDLSFVREDFLDTFNLWLEYKKDIKDSYKSSKSIELCYKKLLNLSNEDPAEAREIVEYSISNGWKGLFKENKNRNGSKNIGTNSNGERDMEEFYRGIASGLARQSYEESK